MVAITIEDIRTARQRQDDAVVFETPVEKSRSLGAMTDATVRLKMEHLQRTGSFKTRGAYNKLQQIITERPEIEHVIAASAGNHAQGVALAATRSGLASTIVMPQDAPQAKIDATEGYGADVTLHGETFQAAMDYAKSIVDDRSVFIHAYDDPAIIAGQGTLGLELAEQVPDMDTVLVPIGGGGLISGVATALDAVAPDVRVIGVQAAGAATVPKSLKQGAPVDHPSPETIADGIATGGISELTFALIDSHVDEIVTVDDDQIAQAIVLLLERAKQLVEGAGAVGVAAMLTDDIDITGETVVPLLCGGNIDMSQLRTVIDHAMADRKQLLQLQVQIDDQPGKMAAISDAIATAGGDIRTVRHERATTDLAVGEAYLRFQVMTTGASHANRITTAIEDAGYPVKRIN